MSIFAEITEKFSPLTKDTFAKNNEKRENFIEATQSCIVEKISNILESFLPEMPYNTTSVVLEITDIVYRDNSLTAGIQLTYSDSITAPIYRRAALFTFNGSLRKVGDGTIDSISTPNFEKGYIYIHDHPEFGKIELTELFEDGFVCSIPISAK